MRSDKHNIAVNPSEGEGQDPGSWGLSKPFGLTDEWPRQENGEFVPPAFLVHKSAVNMEADMVCNMLGAYAIPVLRRYGGNGEFGKVIIGMSGEGVDLYVPATLLEDAKALLEEEGNDGI